MEKFWLKKYPNNVAHEINPDCYASLNDFFADTVKKYRDRPALYHMGRTMTYEELDKHVSHFAAYLQVHLGLKKGDRFGIMLPNVIQYFIAIFGALKAGLTVVNINPLYTPREFSHQIEDAEVKAVLVLANFLHTVHEALPVTHLKHVIVTEVGDMLSSAKSYIINFAARRESKLTKEDEIPDAIPFKTALKKGKSAKLKAVEVGKNDIAFLQYTGGTTGVSKGAMLSHRNIIANLEQSFAWMASGISEDNASQEVAVTALPLYHIFSLTINCFVFMKVGVLNILIANPRDIAGFVKELKKHQVTVFMGVNTLFKALMLHKKFKDIDFASLKIVIGGGMAMHPSVADRWKMLTGAPLLEAYGLTEASPAVCCNSLDSEGHNGSIGYPMPSTDIKIIDDAGHALSIGEVGELCIKGPQVMLGYWNKPEETSMVFTDDGWLKTGDIAKIDEEGLVYIVDRKKEMIVVSGYNVYPSEIELILASHPDVAEVAVLGIPSERTGEFIKAFVVKKDPLLTREELIRYARDHLTTYKIPKHFEFRDRLPKSTVGKILKRTLLEEELLKQKP